MKNSNNTQVLTDLKEEVINSDDLEKIQEYYRINQNNLQHRIKELQRVINIFNEQL